MAAQAGYYAPACPFRKNNSPRIAVIVNARPVFRYVYAHAYCATWPQIVAAAYVNGNY
jgi:hypothetical protein